MKVIFLDVDGVLNSFAYFEEQEEKSIESFSMIDPDNVKRLRRIVKCTDAKLVLSSSWRSGWERDKDLRDPACAPLFDALEKEGMEVYDKTEIGDFQETTRCDEIRKWLFRNREVESFLILDDHDFGWKKAHLDKRWVKTDAQQGGLKEEMVPECIDILNCRITFMEKFLW